MNALQIYFFVVVLAATVFAIKYTRSQADDNVVIPNLGTPLSYRSQESDNTGGIPPWKGRVKRPSTRYFVASSLGHDRTRLPVHKQKLPATPGAEQSAESQSKKRMDFTRSSRRNAKSGGQECERSSLRRGSPMARDVSSDEQQSAESQLEKRNLPYLPPVISLQRSNDYVKNSRKVEARGPTAKKIRKSALGDKGSTVGPSYYDALIEAAQVVSAFYSFEHNEKIRDSSEQEEDGDGSSEKEEDGVGSSEKVEDGDGSSEQEEEGDSSSEQEEESRDTFELADNVEEYFKYEEESKDFFEHEERKDFFEHEDKKDFFEHEESGDEYFVQKSEIVDFEFLKKMPHATPTNESDLDWPVAKECHERMKYVYSIGGLGFYINSWELPENEFRDPRSGEKLSKTFTWVEARNQCRKRCMDLISFETSWELGFYSSIFAASHLPFVWTSGRICDYKECAHRPELEPLILNGWFWTATGVRLPPTNAKPPKWRFQPWSPSGISNDPQPDNAEFVINGKNESCLALMNNVYGDRVAYHDVACYHKMYFTCEDSPALMDMVDREHSRKLIRSHIIENYAL